MSQVDRMNVNTADEERIEALVYLTGTIEDNDTTKTAECGLRKASTTALMHLKMPKGPPARIQEGNLTFRPLTMLKKRAQDYADKLNESTDLQMDENHQAIVRSSAVRNLTSCVRL